MSFRFHPEARQELRDASHFYANAGRQVGLAFADAVERAIYNVRVDPSKFRELEPGVRIHRLQGFPYALPLRLTLLFYAPRRHPVLGTQARPAPARLLASPQGKPTTRQPAVAV